MLWEGSGQPTHIGAEIDLVIKELVSSSAVQPDLLDIQPNNSNAEATKQSVLITVNQSDIKSSQPRLRNHSGQVTEKLSRITALNPNGVTKKNNSLSTKTRQSTKQSHPQATTSNKGSNSQYNSSMFTVKTNETEAMGKSTEEKPRAPVLMFKWGCKERRFRCQVCDMSFMTCDAFKEHTRKHEGQRDAMKPFSCSVCRKAFISQKTLQTHLKVHSGIPICRCKYCHKVFANKDNLDKHILTHTDLISCQHCDEKFVYKSSLGLHQIVHMQRLPYKCERCEKCFKRIDILKRHMSIHEKGQGKKYKCVECGKMYSQPFVLRRHMRSVHSNEPNGRDCEICGKFIRNKENIKRHMKIHENARDFVCSVCGRAFIQKQHLLDHMSTHSTTLDFKCGYCGRAFKHRRTLNRHLQSHRQTLPTAVTHKQTPPIPVTCPQCNTVHPNKHELNNHVREEHSSAHMCTLCNKLIRKDELVRHRKMHEKIGEHSLSKSAFRVFANKSTSTEQIQSDLCLGVISTENCDKNKQISGFQGNVFKLDGSQQDFQIDSLDLGTKDSCNQIDEKQPIGNYGDHGCDNEQILLNHNGNVVCVVYEADSDSCTAPVVTETDNQSTLSHLSEGNEKLSLNDSANQKSAFLISVKKKTDGSSISEANFSKEFSHLANMEHHTSDSSKPKESTQSSEHTAKEKMKETLHEDQTVIISIPEEDMNDNEARSVLFQTLIDYAEQIIDNSVSE